MHFLYAYFIYLSGYLGKKYIEKYLCTCNFNIHMHMYLTCVYKLFKYTTVISFTWFSVNDSVCTAKKVYIYIFCLPESVVILHFFPLCAATVIEKDNDCN